MWDALFFFKVAIAVYFAAVFMVFFGVPMTRVQKAIMTALGAISLPLFSLIFCILQIAKYGKGSGNLDIFMIWLFSLPIQLIMSVLIFLAARFLAHLLTRASSR